MRFLLLALLLPVAAQAQVVPVANPGFDTRDGECPGWQLDGGTGVAGDGRIAVTGDGENSHAWRSEPLLLAPGAVYVLRFRARSEGGRGGTPVSGPEFCNRDLGDLSAEWRAFRSVFAAPRALSADDRRLRFGQWHVRGAVGFDDVELVQAQAVHAWVGDLELGEGERVAGRAYSFVAPYEGEGRNFARPLAYATCRFNTNRWVFGGGDEVVYRHVLETRAPSAARVEVSVGWHERGELSVHASADGKTWREVGRIAERTTRAFELPGRARETWVRLRGSDGCALQVNGYSFSATLDGAPVDATGATRFVEVLSADPAKPCSVASFDPPRPGRDAGVVLRAGADSVRRTLPVPGAGAHDLALDLPEFGFRARIRVYVPQYRTTPHGERLPGSTDAVHLWWASSGWKLSPDRFLPERTGSAVRIALARNEAEAAQFVVGPAKPLRGLRVETGALSGPDGATLPASAVEVLRVRYVNVTQPTDETGIPGEWPDPLPPLRGPLDLAGDRQQPFWVRVRTPKEMPAGLYRGSVRLTAEGWQAEVPLEVEVFDFTLPDRATCTTAFGFDSWLAFHYQRLTDPAQRRAALEKYWESFASHRISPYDPAPLDRRELRWEGGDPWKDGARTDGTLQVVDRSHTEQACARYDERFAIPAGGLRLRFRYRTAHAGQRFIVTLNHHDAAGAWMSGRNLDLGVTGDGAWQDFDRTIATFPYGAALVELRLWATEWEADGGPTGSVWYDDVSLTEAASGRELLRGGDFTGGPTTVPRPVFDWRAWDAEMQRVLDRHGFNSFLVTVPGMGGGTYHSRQEPSVAGFAEGTPEYAALFGACAREIEAHLRERGWRDRAFVYWFDEPEPRDYDFVRRGFLRLKEAAPGLARMLTEQPEPALEGGPDVWCPCTPAFEPEAAARARARGERVWWYVCTGPKAPYCTLFLDHPATELRVWLWQTWQRGVTGVLVWQTNYWTSPSAYPEMDRLQDPYADPMSWVSGYDTPAGVRQPWGNGDGRFLYPPEEPGVAGPVESIRWEMLRDGVEDYEYLAMLRRALEKAGPETAEYRELLDVPPEITRSMTEFTFDPRPIEEQRERIARALEALGRRKRRRRTRAGSPTRRTG